MIHSSNELYTNGSYYSQNPLLGLEDAFWKADKVSAMISRNGLNPQSVCEVGSGSGMILHYLSEMYPNIERLTGYDISPYAIEQSRKIENEKLLFVNSSMPQDSKEVSDVTLMLDVVEHVDDYYQFLRDLLNCGERFIFHIPLDMSCRMVLKPHILLNARNTVGHIHYFTKETIFWSLEDTGYVIRDWFYTKPISDTSASPNFFRWCKKKCRNLFFKISPNLCVKLFGSYSVMVYLEKKSL